MKRLTKQYNVLSKRLDEMTRIKCHKPNFYKFTEELRSVIQNEKSLIACGEVKMGNHPPSTDPGSEAYAEYQMQMKLIEKNYCGCFVFNAGTNHLEESAMHDWEKSIADAIWELMEGRFSEYTVNASPIVMDPNNEDWDLFDVMDPEWGTPFYARHLHFNDKRAFFQDDGSFCTADEELTTREDFLNKINELREAGGKLAMIISIQAQA